MDRFWRQFSIGCVLGLALIAFTVVQAGRHGVIQTMTTLELGERGLQLGALVIVISAVFGWARLVADAPQTDPETDEPQLS